MSKKYIMYRIIDLDPSEVDYVVPKYNVLHSRDYIVRKKDNLIMWERLNWTKGINPKWKKYHSKIGHQYWYNKNRPWVKKVKELTDNDLFIEVI